ncbi:bifunctional hydroxymethylpyrimidine kinase/phosphomethylpyrimidine kinase [Saccharibacillus alkalitolerans]|uniref:Hydroxymethylpyrimidine/phosphomethylpyrimidine kinase n=1 Tax=Saccharibacillus alkalitolerans TaxID=2705290 RepID=A0ABX0F4L7_9BACL|nr:bifunctional hydroxymethylpyrimidine kinase/phosphomethylpyrimidine kinase [Saccharibacillus alkalitolerans]NGZ74949.1 bifunctional hydroxymethylpyrimidine kinase/phosphomethylpyrimidine kinase [Saccharibacillus alkalitolerans]
MTAPRALTIAGSDSGGGAGIQADIKTFQELGAFGMSAITAVTVQNTLGVGGVYPMTPAAVVEQIDAVGSDIGVDALKTGMLFDAAIIEAASARIAAFGWTNVVVDPVMIAKGGAELLRAEAVEAMKRYLLPLALVVTPNIPEAEALAGMPIRTMEDRREAARRIAALGAKTVVIKGGHAEEGAEGGIDSGAIGGVSGAEAAAAEGGAEADHGRTRPVESDAAEAEAGRIRSAESDTAEEGIAMPSGERPLEGGAEAGHAAVSALRADRAMPDAARAQVVVDLVYDGHSFEELTGVRIPTRHTHGTGCTFSAAIAARLAAGADVREAVRTARDFIQAAIEGAPELNLGGGHGPTAHWAYRRLKREGR